MQEFVLNEMMKQLDRIEKKVNAMAEAKITAKWIGKPIAGYSTVWCSYCRSAFLENNGKWKYCPECGAKMNEEK